MDAFLIAQSRSQSSEDPGAFMRGFFRGLYPSGDVDTAREVSRLTKAGETALAAGLLEGLAAVNAAAGLPTECTDPFWKRNRLGRRVAA
jgi:hypothetical protein